MQALNIWEKRYMKHAVLVVDPMLGRSRPRVLHRSAPNTHRRSQALPQLTHPAMHPPIRLRNVSMSQIGIHPAATIVPRSIIWWTTKTPTIVWIHASYSRIMSLKGNPSTKVVAAAVAGFMSRWCRQTTHQCLLRPPCLLLRRPRSILP